MKDILMNIHEYVNFAYLCKKNKVYHEFSVIHGNIHILANSVKLEELGY